VDDPFTRSPIGMELHDVDVLVGQLATLYLVALVMLGMTTLRKGHTWLFVVWIFLPLLCTRPPDRSCTCPSEAG
jgi:hypothetical protein